MYWTCCNSSFLPELVKNSSKCIYWNKWCKNTYQTNSRIVTDSHKTWHKSSEHLFRYTNMSQINWEQRNFQGKYWFFMVESEWTFNKIDKWYIILELRISAFSISKNLENYFQHLQLVLFECLTIVLWKLCNKSCIHTYMLL